MFRKPGIVIFLAAILVAILSIHLATSPSSSSSGSSESSSSSGSPVPADRQVTDTAFSVDRAYLHLQQIARAPHSIGTAENARVRAYIEGVCRELGLTVDIQHTTGMASYQGSIVAGNVYNIIARLKGQQNSKAILLAAHYDSQPNAVGAGDDGASCAAMLETAGLLKKGAPLKNDVVFLFTDGEEDGLLGAHGFVQESPVLKEIGLMINFDNRGNSGVVNMFETNPENGWIMAEYAKAAAHSFANSLNYEVYKLLPNSTDYTVFKTAGIAGLNNALIEGFVNYHSMTDRPENLDRNSFQQDGDNMLSLVRHFGNLDIRETKSPDLSYFNIIGDWLVRYPASLNLFVLVIVNLLFVGTILMGFRKRKIAIKGSTMGILFFLITLVLLFAAGDFTLRGIRKAYPLYDHFYASNGYNAYCYFFALTALGVTIFSLIYRWALGKISLPSLQAGVFLLEVVCLDILYMIAPTAIYFLAFPLVFALIAWLILFYKGADGSQRPLLTVVVSFCLALPAILLLAPIIYLNYVAFGLTAGAAVSLILLGLLSGLLLPVFDSVFRTSRWLIPASSFSLFLISLVIGHLQSGFTAKKPLQTNLRYLVDTDEGKAYWVSDFTKTDDYNRPFFTKSRVGRPLGGYEGSLINDAPLLDLAPPTVTLEKDTLEKDTRGDEMRRIYLHCRAREGAVSIRFRLSDSCFANRIVVDGKEAMLYNPKSWLQNYRSLTYNGLPKEGITVMFEIEPGRPFSMELVDRSMGLPEVQGFNTAYPAGIIPGPDENSNTIQVAKHYRF